MIVKKAKDQTSFTLFRSRSEGRVWYNLRMQAFSQLTAAAAALDRVNVDTDQIIPKQFLRSIRKSGFGPFLFDEWRYLDRGELGMDCSKRPKNPDFSLNRPEYANAKILIARDNFGCGSSREHAVWALSDYGFCAVIAPSFGDIFYTNSIKNGFLPVRLASADVDALFEISQNRPDAPVLQIDLAAQTVTVQDGGQTFHFEIAPDDKTRLLAGLDDIALTLKQSDKIREYEQWRRKEEPWLDGGEL